jgi:hypothetical protein
MISRSFELLLGDLSPNDVLLRSIFGQWAKCLPEHITPKVFEIACGLRASWWIVKTSAFSEGRFGVS